MIQLSENINTLGSTFSSVDSNIYNKFESTNDKDVFEKVIDDLMVERYTKDPEIKEYIRSLPIDNKRIAILSLIGEDNLLWSRINDLLKENKSGYQRLREVYFLLRDYVKIADVERKNHGEVLTPFKEIAEPMVKLVDKYEPEFWKNKNHKVLDSSAGYGTFLILAAYKFMKGLESVIKDEEERFKWIVENCLYYGELQAKSVFSWLVAIDPYNVYKTNTYYGSFLTEDFDRHVKDVWKIEKFNLSIQNPPFKRKTNLKFLNKSMDISDLSIFVHPGSWLIDEKNSNSDFKNAKKIHKNYLEEVIIFNGNKIFNIGLYVPSAITIINKNKKTPGIEVVDNINKIKIRYNDIDEINKFSNMVEYKSILEKIDRNKNLSMYYNKKIGNFYINMSRIRGHVYENGNESMYCDDFYTTITKDEKVSNEVTKSVYFSFDSYLEADNFLNYLKTNFARFCLSICKNSADLNKIDFSKIPYLDFSKKWIDKDLIDEFGLTKNEVDFINKNIPNYYDRP